MLIFSGSFLEVSRQAIEKMICCRSLKDVYWWIYIQRYSWLKRHLHPEVVKKQLNANLGITFVFFFFLSHLQISRLHCTACLPSCESLFSHLPLVQVGALLTMYWTAVTMADKNPGIMGGPSFELQRRNGRRHCSTSPPPTHS